MLQAEDIKKCYRRKTQTQITNDANNFKGGQDL